MRKTIAEVSASSLRLVAILSALQVDEVVTYEVLSAAVGNDVQDAAKGNLATARRRLLREKNLVFGCVSNVGIKRLSDVAIVGLGDDTVRRIGRAAKKGVLTVLSIGDFDNLPEALKMRHNSVAIVLGSQAALSGRKSLDRVHKKLAAARALTLEDIRASIKGTLEAL